MLGLDRIILGVCRGYVGLYTDYRGSLFMGYQAVHKEFGPWLIHRRGLNNYRGDGSVWEFPWGFLIFGSLSERSHYVGSILGASDCWKLSSTVLGCSVAYFINFLVSGLRLYCQ